MVNFTFLLLAAKTIILFFLTEREKSRLRAVRDETFQVDCFSALLFYFSRGIKSDLLSLLKMWQIHYKNCFGVKDKKMFNEIFVQFDFF